MLPHRWQLALTAVPAAVAVRSDLWNKDVALSFRSVMESYQQACLLSADAAAAPPPPPAAAAGAGGAGAGTATGDAPLASLVAPGALLCLRGSCGRWLAVAARRPVLTVAPRCPLPGVPCRTVCLCAGDVSTCHAALRELFAVFAQGDEDLVVEACEGVMAELRKHKENRRWSAEGNGPDHVLYVAKRALQSTHMPLDALNKFREAALRMLALCALHDETEVGTTPACCCCVWRHGTGR